MKRILFVIFPVWFLYACNTAHVNEAESTSYFNEIDSLLKRDEYFAARDRYQAAEDKLTSFHRLKAGVEIDNVFNRLELSNQKINSLLKKNFTELSEKDKYHLLLVKQMNHSRLFEYKNADNAMGDMLTNYKQLMTKKEFNDHQNTKKIWAALVNQPAQKIIIEADTRLDIKQDKLGLQNLGLFLDSLTMDFIFDTGANFSTATESTAKKLNMQFMDTTLINVGSITGKEVKARISICPEFRLGSITVKNAVFLVFPDEALAIPQANFQINGIIGFPVIEAMKEVQLTKKGEFIVPLKKSNYPHQNMALKFLNPVISLDGENYTFDSGANSTTLYDNYFKKYRNSIEPMYNETDLTIGGAGGNITKKGYLVSFKTKVNDRVIELDSVQLFKEKLKDDNFFVGNIGQDLIRKFDKMTINFESMFIRFD